jgi:hypothetical protein
MGRPHRSIYVIVHLWTWTRPHAAFNTLARHHTPTRSDPFRSVLQYEKWGMVVLWPLDRGESQGRILVAAVNSGRMAVPRFGVFTGIFCAFSRFAILASYSFC